MINHQHDHSASCWWKGRINDLRIQYVIVGFIDWKLWPQSTKIVQHVKPTSDH